MTPQQFITKWGAPAGVPGPAHALNEEQGAQSHFLDLCELLGVPKPGSSAGYRFEEKSQVIGGKTGYCDVFMPGVFAWENKAPGKNLDTALKQLLTYSLALSNPPILVVSDRLRIRIHTRFTGHPSETHEVLLHEIDQSDKLALLRRIWTAPESFKPRETSRDITEAAARSFSTLAEGLRRRGPPLGSVGEIGVRPQLPASRAPAPSSVDRVPPPISRSEPNSGRANQVAHFLTQCLFCFFAEDVGLLPERMFERLVNNKRLTAERLTLALSELFKAMASGGMFGADDIPWFNGGLFETTHVPMLSILDVTELRKAANLNWSAIDVSIFGTLFERGLDPAKRSQLGAHYTDPATILRIVEPVITRPLLQLWEQTNEAVRGLMAKSTKKDDKNHRLAQARFVEWLDRLKNFRILDPACGSGNFLFLGLKALKDIEHKSHLDAAALGLDREADLVTGPHNMLGIELNEYAAELARVTVWIGELQWRLAHGYDFKTNPVLEPLDHIECRDALLFWPSLVEAATPDHPVVASGPVEAGWPKASVVIGNPPFLGDKKMRAELGDGYTETLRKTYEGRVPGGADLVCYWFEKARKAIETNGLGAAGLVATNSIRGGKNRAVLDTIAKTTRIYEAWSDEGWVNEGAAVRVSLVAFGHATQPARLDGQPAKLIHADLTPGNADGSLVDLTTAVRLNENVAACFEGIKKYGPFDVPGDLARDWLRQSGNPNKRPNSDVIRPWINATDVVRKDSDTWVIDFTGLSEQQAASYEKPFEFARQKVLPTRANDRNSKTRTQWWLYERARTDMRKATTELPRFIVTPVVAKHRIFAWRCAPTLAMNLLDITARADDTTFGILHSRFHELWSLRMCTWLGVGNDPRYTPTTCFETFPFPTGLTPADTAHQQTETLPDGAIIPADLSVDISEEKVAVALSGIAQAASKTVAFNSLTPRRPEASTGSARTEMSLARTGQGSTRTALNEVRPGGLSTRDVAIPIAQAAKRLNDLREAWLNPPEWTHKVEEVTPLGLDQSPYPDRIEPLPGIREEDRKALQKRTLTNLYNLRPAWLAMAHQQLDAAVAAAYGLADYTPTMTDEEILKRLLALNLARSYSQ